MTTKTETPCAGMACGFPRDQEHSAQCIAEHAAAVAGGRFVPLGAETEALAAECKRLRLEACKLSVRASFNINSEVLDALTAAESAADAAIDRLAALAQPVAPAEGTINVGAAVFPWKDTATGAGVYIATPTAAKAAPPELHMALSLRLLNAANTEGDAALKALLNDAADALAGPAFPLPEQAEDAARLNALEQKLRATSYSIVIQQVRDPDINAGVYRTQITLGAGSGPWAKTYEAASLRAAIDAARKDQP